MKRLYLTDREQQEMCERQNWCCAICELPFGTERIEFDHEIPHAFRPDQKPTQAVHRSCHRIKSAADWKDVSKSNRRRKKAPRLHRTLGEVKDRPKRKIQSRGFDKNWSRRMDGKTVPRPTPNARAEV